MTQLQAAIERVAAADAIVASTPIYKAGISGLLKPFCLLGNPATVARAISTASGASSTTDAELGVPDL